MTLLVGMHYIATPRSQSATDTGEKGEFMEIANFRRDVIAILHFAEREINGAAIDARRRTGLHTAGLEPETSQLLRDMARSLLRNSAARQLHTSEMHVAAKESTGGKDHLWSMEFHAETSAHTRHRAVVFIEKQRIDAILKEIKIVGILQDIAPHIAVFAAVALHAGRPHSRAFRSVEHTELHRGLIGHNAHHAAKSINLTDDLSLGNTTYSRVARHLGDTLHIGSHQQHRASESCGCHSSLTTGMACAYHYYVVVKTHGA